MKKLCLLAASILLLLFVSCNPVESTVAVTDVVLSKTTLALTEGATSLLKAEVKPADATDKTVVWSSSNASVATVEDGLVTAVSSGTATITATASGVKAECVVTVSEEIISVSGISLDIESLELKTGETSLLTAMVEPSGATDKTVTWTISDDAVATVDGGLVVAVGVGAAVISAEAGGFTATCTVAVEAAGYEMVDIGLSVPWADRNVGASSPGDLGGYYAWGETDPKEEYTWATYKWSNDDGTSFSKYNGLRDAGTIDYLNCLDLEDDAACVNLGGKWRTPTYSEVQELLATEHNPDYQWSLTNVDGNDGYQVKYLVNGNSIFLPFAGYRSRTNLSSADMGYYQSSVRYTASSTIHALSVQADRIGRYGAAPRYYGLSVRPVYGEKVEVTDIVLDQTNLTMNEGDELQLTATLVPENPSERNIEWTSSDETVAVVENGLVKAFSAGQATIVASSLGGSKYAICKINVEFVMPEKVDLGLSVMWADRNMGASVPEKCGLYYGWGELSPVAYYYWRYYKFIYSIMNYNNTGYEYYFLSKYNNLEEEGTVDNLTALLPEDDAARVKYGDNWRMPTASDMEELFATRNNSDYKWEWTSMGGVNGFKVTYLSNGNSIFLPAAGIRDQDMLLDKSDAGYYWTKDLNASNPYRAKALEFYEFGDFMSAELRWDGMSIRPVFGD